MAEEPQPSASPETSPSADEAAAVDDATADASPSAGEEQVAPEPVSTPETPPPAGEVEPEATPTAEAPAASPAPESSERARRQRDTMQAIRQAMEAKEPIEGQVIGWNRGGYHVAIGEIAAFCPVSQIEIGNPRSPKRYVDRAFPFIVIEIEGDGRRVVLSRAEALKVERERRLAEVRARLRQGEVFDGKVSSLTDFGAFVDLGGGVEGLVHVSEISHRRVEHPKEALRRGQSVKVTVLKVEENGDRISLSMKAFEPDPWQGASERYPSGSRFTGTIARKTDFGLFVQVEPGLEGLVHQSRLPHGVELEDASLEAGQQVEGWVHDCAERRRRLSLSLREISNEDPWKDVATRYRVGELVNGTVERLAAFGAFVELEPGLTALLPFSQVSTPPGSDPKRHFHPGKGVSARVLSVDARRRRISLGSETSTAEGSQADYKEYQRRQKGSGLNTMAAAFEKLKVEAEQAG